MKKKKKLDWATRSPRPVPTARFRLFQVSGHPGEQAAVPRHPLDKNKRRNSSPSSSFFTNLSLSSFSFTLLSLYI